MGKTFGRKPRITFLPRFKASPRGECSAEDRRLSPTEIAQFDARPRPKPAAIPSRITPQMIDAEIADEVYHTSLNGLTVCVLILHNGFTVTGESRPIDPAELDADLGRDLAKGKARQRITELLAFRLADQRHLEEQRAELLALQKAVCDETVDAMIAAAIGRKPRA